VQTNRSADVIESPVASTRIQINIILEYCQNDLLLPTQCNVAPDAVRNGGVISASVHNVDYNYSTLTTVASK
jgi:hypothetical protein